MDEGQTKTTATVRSVQEIVESIVGPVEWISNTEGYCTCPGKNQHTTRDGKRDCMVYTDPVVTLRCFHSGCSEIIENTNRKLRRAVKAGVSGDAEPKKRMTPEEKKRLQAIQRRINIRKRAAGSKARVLQEHTWPYDQLCADSPVPLADNAEEHWKLLINLFADGDFIWIGSIYDSGKETHSVNFRTKQEWLKEAATPAQYICPATFKPGSFSRGNEHIAARRFLVVESDVLSKDEIGAVFRWLKDKAGLNLRCIVDTAGKSLHGWFDFPTEEELDDLKLILPAYDCDPKLFTASQPVRLPGALRDGKFQRLVYLAKGGSNE